MFPNCAWTFCFIACIGIALSDYTAQNQNVHILETEPLTYSMVKKLSSQNQLAQVELLDHPQVGQKAHIITYDKELLEEKYHSLGIHLNDVTISAQEILDKTVKDNCEKRRKCLKARCTDHGPFLYYPTLDEINEWLKKHEKKNCRVSVRSIGKTVEGRPLTLVIINGNKGLPIVFIESGIHAREWLSVSTALYFIYKIVNGSSANLTKRFEFHFLVNTNPDGYAYTHSEADFEHRFWRKNRHVFSSKCIGVDLNRNFDVKFGTVGVKHDCQDDTYPGPKAFSEKETEAVYFHILKNKRRIKLYLSLHTYGQLLMFPYGFTKEDAPNHDQLMQIALEAVKTIKLVSGRTYRVQKQIDLYLSSGTSVDWAYEKANISLSYIYELRPKKPCLYSFIVPTSYIVPTGEEIFASFITMLQYIQ